MIYVDLIEKKVFQKGFFIRFNKEQDAVINKLVKIRHRG